MNIEIRESKTHGMGVFAVRKFVKDEVIIDWKDCTEVLSNDQVLALSSEERKFISIIEGQNVQFYAPARFVNHSCSPTAFSVNGGDRAIRGIDIGEEITVDYALQQVPGLSFYCSCGSSNCRGLIQ